MRAEGFGNTDGLIGTVLLGRFRVVRELAKGGMGVVYLARQEGAVGFVKPVVIKLMLPEHATDDRFVDMFKREAKILSRLRHPGIVDVIELGEEDGAYIMVLEYVHGYHLGQWNKYLKKTSRQIPADIVILLMIDVLDALHYAHEQKHPDGTPMQIVHRDVSPSNILLDEEGHPRLLDFGVARMRGGDYTTQVRAFVGKLTYSAPELFAGEEASRRSDVYSCGVVLHELLVGRNVFHGKNQQETLQLVLHHSPEPVELRRPDVPSGIDRVISKATAKAADERYATAHEFSSALRRLLQEPEGRIRTRLATLLKDDFGDDIAEVLGIESLAARDEAWRRLSLRPPSLEENTAVELQTRADQTSRPRPRQTTTTTGNFTPPMVPLEAFVQANAKGHVPALPPALPAAMSVTQPIPTAPNTNRAVFAALAVVACLALVAIVVSLRGMQAQPAAAVPAIRIVAENTPPAPSVRPQAPEPEPAEPEIIPEVAEPPSKKHKSAPTRPQGPDPASLTRAFRKQQAKVEACFQQNTSAQNALPKIQLAFDLDATGKARRVAVEPENMASTALGQCLRAVGTGTDFPAQGEPVSFAIPITASRN